MPNYNPANINDYLESSGDDGNAMVYFGSAVVSANLANGDKVRPCRVAAGVRVHRVVIKNPDLDSGTTLQFKIGFQAIDGSTQAAGDDTAVAAAGQTTWQDADTTTYEILPPFLVTKDSYLEVACSAAGVGTGTVYAKVEGEGVGAA